MDHILKDSKIIFSYQISDTFICSTFGRLDVLQLYQIMIQFLVITFNVLEMLRDSITFFAFFGGLKDVPLP